MARAYVSIGSNIEPAANVLAIDASLGSAEAMAQDYERRMKALFLGATAVS